VMTAQDCEDIRRTVGDKIIQRNQHNSIDGWG
jgi:hypothetical protein